MKMLLLLSTLVFVLLNEGPVKGQETRAWEKSTSFISLVPSQGSTVAIVIFHNEQIQLQTETFELHMPGLTITVRTMIRDGAMFDSMAVTVPTGFIAVPPVLDVEEGETGVTKIYSTVSAGA